MIPTTHREVLKARSEALRFLREAEGALDQAHAEMRDARIEGCRSTAGVLW